MLLTPQIQEEIDKEYFKWANQWRLRLFRVLSYFIGIEFVFNLFNNPFRISLSLGWKHGYPHGFLAIHKVQIDGPTFVIAALDLSCGEVVYYWWNQEHYINHKPCEKCSDLRQESASRYAEATSIVLARYLNQPPEEDDRGRAVTHDDKPPQDPEGDTVKHGALGSWMGVN